jgi:hypothetical protein
LLAGQAEELKHFKRKKNEVKEENLRMTKEVLILHEANSKMKEQLRDLKSQVNGDSTIDKLMA